MAMQTGDTYGNIIGHSAIETTSPVADVRVNDRITLLAGKARSAHTRLPLRRDVTIDVTFVKVDDRSHGTVHVGGIELTGAGRWRANMPSRAAVVATGDFTAGVRVGDTAAYNQYASSHAVVTAIDVRHHGGASAHLLYPSGATGSCPLHHLHLVTRADTEPDLRACGRCHAQDACARCAEADHPVATCCMGGAGSCTTAADVVITWTPPGGTVVRTYCQHHADRFSTVYATTVRTILDGVYTVLDDGTQVAICCFCGHPVYRADHGWPWQAGSDNGTGRCTGPAVEDGPEWTRHHRAALTTGEADIAITRASCGTAHDRHALDACPARRS